MAFRATIVGLLCIAICAAWPGMCRGQSPRDADAAQIEQLIDTLSHPDQGTAASQALTRIGAPALPLLFEAFGKRDVRTRQKIAQTLGEFGPLAKDAVDDLIRLLPDREFRDEATSALVGIGEPAIAALAAELETRDSRRVYHAIRALTKFGPEIIRVLPELTRIVGDRGQGDLLRFWAAAAIGVIGPDAKSAVPALLRAVEELHNDDKSAAIRAIGEIGPAAGQAVPALLEVYKAKRRLYNFDAAGEALVKIGRPTLPHLIAALDDDYPRVREGAAHLLIRIGKPAVPHVIRAMQTGQPMARVQALLILSRIGEPAVADLIPLLESRRWSTRFDAARTLATIPTATDLSIPTLTLALKSSDLNTRLSAAASIATIGAGGKAAVPALLDALRVGTEIDNPNIPPEVWQSYVGSISDAIARVGVPALPDLADATMSSDVVVREGAVISLAKIGASDWKAVPKIASLAMDQDERVRQSIAASLKMMAADAKSLSLAGKSGLPALLAAVRDPAAAPRHTAADALSRIGEPAVSGLIEVLYDANPEVRRTAARTLGDIGAEAKAAVPVLVESMRVRNAIANSEEDIPQTYWRQYVFEFINALAKIGSPSVEGVLGATFDRHPEVRVAAVTALGRIGREAKPAVSRLVDLLESDDLNMRLAVIEALGRIRNNAEDAIVPLIAQLKLREIDLPKPKDLPDEIIDNFRRRVAESLVRIGESAVSELSIALDHPIENVRQHAAWAIMAINPTNEVLDELSEAAVPHLINAIQTEDYWVRFAAAQVLRRAGTKAKDAVPVLVKAMHVDPAEFKNEQVGSARFFRMYMRFLAEALSRIGEPAVPALTKSLKDPNPLVRQYASIALQQMAPDMAAETLAKLDSATLVKTLNQRDRQLGQKAAIALEQRGKQAVPALIAGIKGDDPDVVRESIRILAQIGDAAAPALIEAAKEKRAVVRAAAVRALAGKGPAPEQKIPAPGVVSTLVTALEDEDATVRRFARRALLWVDPETAKRNGIEVRIDGE